MNWSSGTDLYYQYCVDKGGALQAQSSDTASIRLAWPHT